MSVLRQALIGLLFVCLMAAPAAASHLQVLKGGYTQAETTSVLALASAISSLEWSLHETALSQADFNAWYAELYTGASRELFLALAFLHHTNPEQVNTPQYEGWESSSRAGWVGRVWFHLDRALVFMGPPWGLKGNVTGAGAPHLDNALAALASINRTLAYATPLPGDQPGEQPGEHGTPIPVTPTVVGPHGILRNMQWSLHRGGHYLHDALEAARTALQAQSGPGTPPPARDLFRKASQALLVNVANMMFIANVPTFVVPAPPERPTMPRRFVDVDIVYQWLTLYDDPFSIPFRLNEVVRDGVAPWQNLATAAAVRAALVDVEVRVSDAWRHWDRAMRKGGAFNFSNAEF